MGTKISHKVQECRTPSPPYFGITLKKQIYFVSASLKQNDFFDCGHIHSYVKLNFRLGSFSCIFRCASIS